MRETASSAALDTNLLLLWLAGNVDRTLLKTFKRVQDFTVGDYRLLQRTVTRFRDLFTTPHVLTETSNFIGQASLYRRDVLLAALESFINNSTEMTSPARELSCRPEFRPFGLTDTGLSDLSGRVTVITMDYRLHGRIEAQGGSCINFNHLRSLANGGSA